MFLRSVEIIMPVDMKETFLKQSEQLDHSQPAPALGALRRTARSRLRDLPFPTPRAEDWRFTNVAPILQTPFETAPRADKIDNSQLPPLPTADAIRLTFVNGWYNAALSNVGRLAEGVDIGNLAAASAEQAKRLAEIASTQEQVFTALNTALLQDGAYVLLREGVLLVRPIELLYVTLSRAAQIASQPRTLIVAGRSSQATIVERFLPIGQTSANYFTNAVTEIALADNASIDHYKVQQESLSAYHVANTQAVLARDATFTTHYIALGGGLVRNEVRVRFDGPGGEATVNGLYLGAGKQHLDNFTVIDHAQPHCASHELYKGVLGEQAHGVFNGKIFVRPDAQKTDAKQTNKVLLLSDAATINTKPQLEIFADDVQCTHGATVGQLDADQIFYLQTRGIPVEQARRLLTFAFANDIVGRIKLEAIREQLERVLVERNL